MTTTTFAAIAPLQVIGFGKDQKTIGIGVIILFV